MLNTMADMTALALVVIGGCVANRAELLNNKQAMALHRSGSRAIPDQLQRATGEIISRKVLQPALQEHGLNRIQRTEFTVGMTGCGK